MPNNNYLTFDQAKQLFQEVGYKFKRAAHAYTVKGNATLATLPAASANTEGFVFNMTAEFTTTADFVEGAGKKYSAGTNVAIVDVTPITYTAVSSPAADANPKYSGWYEKDASQDVYFLTADGSVTSGKTYYTATPGTAAYKYDVIANFVDVDGITGDIADVKAAIAPEFDATTTYTRGDLVFHDGILYLYLDPHDSFTGEWPENQSSSFFTRVDDLTTIAKFATHANDYVEVLDNNFAPDFDENATYGAGDFVMYNGRVHTFSNSHTGPWSESDVMVTRMDTWVTSSFYRYTSQNIAPYFDENVSYAIGNVVSDQGKLYKFKAAHTAGNEWSSSEVDEITVADLISNAEPEALTTTQMNTLIGLL